MRIRARPAWLATRDEVLTLPAPLGPIRRASAIPFRGSQHWHEAVWLVSAALLVAKLSGLAWVLAFAIAVMVALDASVDFCVLCFLFMQLERFGLLPGVLRHRANPTMAGEL